MLTIELDGILQLTHTLQRLATGVMAPLGEALYEEGNRIMGESVQLVPIDTGLLRSTAHVERPLSTGASVEVELRYGSHGLAEYAIVQHEDVTLNHPNGGTAKFLQTPLLAAVDDMPARIGTALMPALRS